MATISVRRKRRESSSNRIRLHKPVWVDNYPWIEGTHPEKLVFQELAERHIAFDFQILLVEAVPAARGLPVLNQSPYRADFLIQSCKLVLDPWDPFHHSDPQQAKDDAEKLAVYRALGYTTYWVWADELEKNGAAWWLNQMPELSHAAHGPFKTYHTQNDTAGIAAANRSRRTFPALSLKTRRSR